MKKLQPSFAAVIAMIAICFTLVAKAQQRKITQCFTVATLINSSGQFIRSYPVPWECFAFNWYVNTLGYQWMGQHPALIPATGCGKEEDIFCCVTFELDPDAPASVPMLSVDGMYGKFKVSQVYCRPQ